jgi:glycine betaine/choline ABC-type transport system substrate-binding protein
VTSTKETAEKLGNPTTMSELVEKAGNDMSLSGFPECRQRTDCLVGLKQVYSWEPKFISSPGQYNDLDKGQADFTMGFSTDGPLATGKYVTYEDDKSLFPPYYVTFLVGEKGLETLGDGGREVIERVQEPLTEEVMQELNSRVTLDKQEPEQVAKDYLTESGFLEASS